MQLDKLHEEWMKVPEEHRQKLLNLLKAHEDGVALRQSSYLKERGLEGTDPVLLANWKQRQLAVHLAMKILGGK